MKVAFGRYARERRMLHCDGISLQLVDGRLCFWAKYKGR
jgi:hypothetical protein